MNARETVYEVLRKQGFKSGKKSIDYLFQVIEEAGFTIMSKEDVERIERAILDDREGKVSAATVLHMIKDAMQR